MDSRLESLRVKEGEKLDLADRPTRVSPIYSSKQDYKAQLKRRTKDLIKFQRRFYAANTYALLLIFQAMDTAGKDGAIRHVMSGVNPQGCTVTSFKHPSAVELQHDFLWRTTQFLPERGHIGIFNRSYYEEVLIVRVHPEILEAQNLPPEATEADVWKQRYHSINEHEKHLHRNGTRIVKFFLHLSREEQARRLVGRIDDPDKNWKFSRGDIDERQHWDDYQEAYENALRATSTDYAPWFVVPADDKRNARLFVSGIILDLIETLEVDYPSVTDERREEMQMIREQLAAGAI